MVLLRRHLVVMLAQWVVVLSVVEPVAADSEADLADSTWWGGGGHKAAVGGCAILGMADLWMKKMVFVPVGVCRRS
jgi:hypothetical protein